MRNPTIDNSKTPVPCTRCGAMLPGGASGCRTLFEEIITQEYSDPAYGAVNLLTVDAYALQHPEDHGAKSNPFHLIRLCWLLEQGGDPRIGQGPDWLQRQFDGDRKFPVLPPPVNRGRLTIVNVYGAASPEEHAERVYRWARAVWEAWRAHHEWARQWFPVSK